MYKTMNDLGGLSIHNALVMISLAVPYFFEFFCFFLLITLIGGLYFAAYNYSGKRRFFNSLSSASFVTLLVSVLLALNNTLEYTILNGLWVVFYIVITIISYIMLTYYK